MSRSYIFVLLALFSAIAVGDESDPQFLARIQYFHVQKSSAFTCSDPGARCEFSRGDFDSVHFGRGQESQILDKAVWAATVEGAVLSLGECTEQNCEVACNANCTCTTGEDMPCVKGEAPAPTNAPVAAPLVGPVCEVSRFTQFCPELMQTALTPGNEQWYDCFNFCGGVFDTACKSAEKCGKTICSNATAAGTLTGEVFGCTVDHLNVEYGSQKSAGAGPVILTSLLAAVSAAAYLF